MTDEEFLAEIRRKADAKLAEQKAASVAPQGATENEPRDFSMSRAFTGNFLDQWMGGKLPQYTAQATTIGKGMLSDLDRMAGAVGFPDLMNFEPPVPSQELAKYTGILGELEEEHPNAALAGAVGGALTNPANITVGGMIGKLPGPVARIPATAAAAGLEDLNYNYNRGMRGDELVDNATTAAAFAGPLQAVGEGIGGLVRRYGQSRAAGDARAKNSVREVIAGVKDPSLIEQAAKEAGPHAIAADIEPGILGAVDAPKMPIFAMKRFYDFMRRRQVSSRDNLRNRLEADFNPRDTLTPGNVEQGIEAYRTSLQPRYDKAFKEMDAKKARVNGSTLRKAMEVAIARGGVATNPLDLGAPMDAYKEVLNILNKFAKDKLGDVAAGRLERAARQRASQIGQQNGLSGDDLKDFVAGEMDRFSLLDHVEFTGKEAHRLKQSLDAKIPGVSIGDSDREIKRAAFFAGRKELANSLNSISDTYRKLNAEFAGSATAKEAYEFGLDVLKSKDTSRDLGSVLGQFEPGDVPFLMEGMKFSMINEVLDADNVKAMAKRLRDPKFGAKLAELVGEDAANSLLTDTGNFLTQIQTADGAMAKLSSRQKQAFAEKISGAWKNLVDLGLVGGVVANAIGSGQWYKGQGMYSGAFMGSARRLAANAMGADIAQGEALADMATMPAAAFSKMVKDLPGTGKIPMDVPGWMGGASALALATDPMVTAEGVAGGAVDSYELLKSLLDEATR